MIINSLLDTDLYKLTMMQAVLHHFPSIEVEYTFKSRGSENLLDIEYQLIKEVEQLCTLSFQPDELRYLSTLPFFTSDFIEFLRLFQFNKKYVEITHERSVQGLSIKVRGPWLHTILFEVPILAIVSELYFKDKEINLSETYDRIEQKHKYFNKNEHLKFADFGTRRRHSFHMQNAMLNSFTNGIYEGDSSLYNLQGTSNVYFAKKYNIKPIGTMAHEWLQAGQALGPRLIDSQKFMLETWVQEYRGDLGIALTDVIGVDAFIKDFDLYFAKLYDGVRHDSGCPLEFGNKIINMYRDLGIDPKTKAIVYSDGLHPEKCQEIYNHFSYFINLSFGIGTNLTNDVDCGFNPLKIVMKMTKCNGQPVAKISDSPGKGMCEDEGFVNYLKSVFNA